MFLKVKTHTIFDSLTAHQHSDILYEDWARQKEHETDQKIFELPLYTQDPMPSMLICTSASNPQVSGIYYISWFIIANTKRDTHGLNDPWSVYPPCLPLLGTDVTTQTVHPGGGLDGMWLDSREHAVPPRMLEQLSFLTLKYNETM